MGTRDPRVDAYIAKSADFAKPILTHLRDVVHSACPEVEETIKWSAPFFDYKGTLCNMAAFNHHCAFGFWKASLVLGEKAAQGDAAGHFGKITSIKDLPPKKELAALIQKAATLNEQGVKVPQRAMKKFPKPPSVAPDDLIAALKKNKAAAATFEGFPPSHKREYIDWIIEAKSDATRSKRLQQTIEMLSEGKSRNWKYAKK